MSRQQMMPGFKVGSGIGRKLVGLAIVVALVVFVVSSPLEAAALVRHFVHSLVTFFHSF
ncbi:hypothetical protein SAMN05421837_10544 [Amycolatopsis pretoriensis]|uniref:Uncharacterized protein n=1 Tax=Amycolatopsis pretoriensis TaxID=218821 RepID=A0A1H5QXX3_9PSEU|nr:hypothetical protein [Amycolatopsis pretoriensis]SEF30181.1 hypothetical protein SAMN05421837_10544 [Amycolatopsis pretoriensis]